MVEQIDKHTWVGMSVDRAWAAFQSRLTDGLAVLATVGSHRSVRHGLFGTVWGIYNALVKDRHQRPGLDRQGGRPGGRERSS